MADFDRTGRVISTLVNALARSGAVRWLAATLSAATLFGCAGAGVSLSEVDYDPRLLTGETVFGSAVEVPDAPVFDMLQTDDAMRAFIDGHVGDSKRAERRFEALLRGLSVAGYFDDTYTYDAGRTYTAAETFNRKAGNCLSYTTMFIALARAADLQVDYQIVDVPASWDADDGYLIRYNHINAVVSGSRIERRFRGEVAVDFNAVQPAPEYPRRRITDANAMALFYSNRSVDHIVAGETRRGFALLRKALEIMPDNVDLWLNLGAFYAKQDQAQMAVLAHHVAIKLDPSNKSALSGLARGYERLGDREKADFYGHRVRNYRRNNAYFQFALAQRHYDRADYDSALQSIDAAINLKRGNPRFHFMKGLVEQKQGHIEAARVSFSKAQKLGRFDDIKARYIQDLAGVPVK